MSPAHEFISHSAASTKHPGPFPAIQTLLMQLCPVFIILPVSSGAHPISVHPSGLSPLLKMFSATVSLSGDSFLSLIILCVSLICLLRCKLMGNKCPVIIFSYIFSLPLLCFCYRYSQWQKQLWQILVAYFQDMRHQAMLLLTLTIALHSWQKTISTMGIFIYTRQVRSKHRAQGLSDCDVCVLNCHIPADPE